MAIETASSRNKAQWDSNREKKKNIFDVDYWRGRVDSLKKNSGSLDVDNKAINFPTTQIPSKEVLWNDYVSKANNRGVRPDYNQFLEHYNLYKNESQGQLLKLINGARALNYTDKEIRNALNTNNAKQELQNIIVNSNDPDVASLYGDLFDKDKTFGEYWSQYSPANWGKMLGNFADDHPLATVLAPTALAAYAGKRFYDRRQDRKVEGTTKTKTETKPKTNVTKVTLTQTILDDEWNAYNKRNKNNTTRKYANTKAGRAAFEANYKAGWDNNPKSKFEIESKEKTDKKSSKKTKRRGPKSLIPSKKNILSYLISIGMWEAASKLLEE